MLDLEHGTTNIDVLLVEPDAATRLFLVDNLTADGFTVTVAAMSGVSAALAEQRSLLVCTVGGYGDVAAVRDAVARGHQVIVLAHAPPSPREVMSGAQLITKPFSYPELRMRLMGLLGAPARV